MREEMKYEYAPDIQQKMEDFSKVLFPHVKIDRVKCFRSYGSSTQGVYARCHTIGKLMQKAMGVQAFYTLEFLCPRFEKLSNEDPVTGLLNRRIVFEIMVSELARFHRYSRPFSVIISDIDNFKKIIDSYGHIIGDKCLKSIGNIFIKSSRSVDIKCASSLGC